MIRPVKLSDLETMRQARNKWYNLGIFRQQHEISEKEQHKWYHSESNRGFIINERAYGKVYDDNEVSFYGFDEWLKKDIEELLNHVKRDLYFGECYQHNPFLYLWLECGFKVERVLRNRKYWDGKMWDGLLLEKENNDIY